MSLLFHIFTRMLSWARGSLLFQQLTQPKIMTIEAWAEKNSRITTPDDIIVAHIIDSIARNFDDWALIFKPRVKTEPAFEDEFIAKYERLHSRFLSGDNALLENQKKKITMFYRVNHYDDEYNTNYKINGVSISDTHGKYIIATYKKVKSQVEAVKEEARRAKREMEENEKKWNLAEKLLGMKRNEYGALVPVVQAGDTRLIGELGDRCANEGENA